MIKVGVLRGGPSHEYDVSLSSGEHILSILRETPLSDLYETVDIFIDKDGVWHTRGLVTTPEKVARNVDVVINALHGAYGEDGKVQQILENLKIPYTGSGAFASAIGMNKKLSKDQFHRMGIKTPRHILFRAYQEELDGDLHEYAHRKARETWEFLPPPWIVKPVSGGSSMGIHVCHSFKDLENAFLLSTSMDMDIIAEEMIEGKEATVSVIENFRGKDLYTPPPIEIRLKDGRKCFDYESKYSGDMHLVCPGRFSRAEILELERFARLIHKDMNLRHYSRSDFIVSPKRGIYVLEVNTLPGLTRHSLLPRSIDDVGSSMSEFVNHIINLALHK